MITIELCNLDHKDDFVNYIKDFQIHGDDLEVLSDYSNICSTYLSIEKNYKNFTEEEIQKSFDHYIKFMINCKSYETVGIKGWVEADHYFILKDGKMIGELNFRKRLSPNLLKNSLGHIGYRIRHSERGNGYMTEALKLLIQKAWNDGYTELMITCDKSNIASNKVIKKCGGILNRINKKNKENPIKEYWIFSKF